MEAVDCFCVYDMYLEESVMETIVFMTFSVILHDNGCLEQTTRLSAASAETYGRHFSLHGTNVVAWLSWLLFLSQATLPKFRFAV